MLDNGLVLAQVSLVGEEGRRVVVFAKRFKGWDRGLDHGDVVRLEDELEDFEDA